MDFSEFYDSFFEEAEELLADMEQHLLDLDLDEPDAEQMNAIFRAAHSIKGGAGAFNFTALQETTHLLENLLDYARHGQLILRRDLVDLFLSTKDILQDQINAYRQGTEPDAQVFADTCATLKRVEKEEMGEGGASAEAPAAAPAKPAQEAKAAAPAAAPSPAAPGPEAPDYVEDANAEPLTRIATTLQYLARHGQKPTTVAEEAAAEEAQDQSAQHRLEVCLLKVAEADRKLLLEELAHLGEVVDSEGDEERFRVVLDSTEDADSIEAVMCFIIESDQLEIKTLASAAPTVAAPAPATAAEPAAPATPAPAAASSAAPKAAKKTEESAQTSIRVSVDKVDQIINLVGELIIIQSMMDQTAQSLGEHEQRQLQNGLIQLQRTSRDLQESVMGIRMLPMDHVFSRYPRQVRDLAAKLNKEVELVTEGKSTELDKGLIEKITDPLTHLVRNSLDHGIEMPDIREAAGKPRVGVLTLSARHAGGNIVIEVADDGAGLNRGKLLSKAKEKGLKVSDDMSDDEVWQLIFAPGFSTADVVSDVSGRGVGMDVVKRNIQSMGGTVEIMSTPGKGTTTRVLLPLTLAILDGMSVRVGEEMFVLPLTAVSELIQPEEEDLFTMAGNDQLLKVRDEYLPIVALHEIMNVPGARTNPLETIAIIVQDEERSYALLVDEPVGQQQVVVKNLESNYRKVPGISAATILGDGRVALILDPVGLHRCEHARKKYKSSQLKKGQTSQFLWEVNPS